MTDIKLHLPIGEEDANRWYAMWGEEEAVFSLETLQRIFEQNTEEKDFRFNIHCNGGSVYEGLAIYDALRTSGKNLYMNIEGGCHSMAVTLLLAAPAENRTANANCRALIHEVQVPVYDYSLSVTDLQELQQQAQQEQDAILDIYADRTGTDRTTLENLMKEEKVRTASELLQYGFISKINSYNTNQKTSKKMSKNQKTVAAIVNRLDDFLRKTKNLLEGQTEPVNYDFTDADGNVLFSTEKEDDSLAVGDAASPDGTFELPDGRTVTIADGAVTEISEPASEDEEVANLRAENAQLREQLEQATNLLTEARNQIGSNYTPPTRQNNSRKAQQVAEPTMEEMKNELREKREKMKGGNK